MIKGITFERFVTSTNECYWVMLDGKTLCFTIKRSDSDSWFAAIKGDHSDKVVGDTRENAVMGWIAANKWKAELIVGPISL